MQGERLDPYMFFPTARAGRVAASGAKLSAEKNIRYILFFKPLLDRFPIKLRVMYAIGLRANIAHGTNGISFQQINKVLDLMVGMSYGI